MTRVEVGESQMTQISRLSRRQVLVGGAAFGAATPLMAQDLLEVLARSTPSQQLGPFYPTVRPLDQDSDLTRLNGSGGTASGEIIDLFGTVFNHDGHPIAGAKLDLWQANALGRYMHGGDRREDLPLDPHFQGSAVLVTDSDGRYRFRTILPGIYAFGGVPRPRHIHFDISSRQARLVTQMYFPGEKENALEDIKEDSLLVARTAKPLEDNQAVSAFNWDIKLPYG
jgi:protocatechuate 3,4-dioxygenase, beta subunit